MVYQSLYRRYRPGKFKDIAGQAHVVAAVRNAIRDDRTGHAYLFSGPRGTGKTSTARIMAKALNCTNLSDEGEPCGECESCQSFDAGTSYDLHELDAASNNGVEAIRDLIAKVALGSPGRTKVYILDEVHMLTSGAENALLKTLEEPPDHVKFVLATTEPHKVVSTIRSRTQHLNFELLPGDTVTEYVRWIIEDAGLDVDDEALAHVVRAGGGSMRDTLSALDQVVAAGGVPTSTDALSQIVDGIAAGDSAITIHSVEEALRSGRDPRVIGESVLAQLRDGFLASIGADISHLAEADRAKAESVASTAGAATLTRAMETIGAALVDMRQAPDPRVDLEVALLRLTKPELSVDPAALIQRIERLEQGAPTTASPAPEPAKLVTSTATEKPTESAEPDTTETAAEPDPAPVKGGVAAAAREQLARPSSEAAKPSLGALRKSKPDPTAATEPTAAREPAPEVAPKPDPEPERGPESPPEAKSEPAPAADTEPASGGEADPVVVAAAWQETLLPKLSKRARARLLAGKFATPSDTGRVRLALPNQMHCDRCQELRPEVEAMLAEHFGHRIEFEFIVEDPAAPEPPKPAVKEETPEEINVDELVDADVSGQSELERLAEAFPGAEIVEPE